MSAEPRDGAVDVDGRVHENVYVTGAAVLPTPGFANQVALALRPADHLVRAGRRAHGERSS